MLYVQPDFISKYLYSKTNSSGGHFGVCERRIGDSMSDTFPILFI